MAHATLTVQNISRAGLKPTYTAVTQANGARFNNSGTSFLEIINTGGASVTVTVVIQSKLDGQTVTNRTYTVPHTASPTGNNTLMIGPFPTTIYNTTESFVFVNVSADGCVMAVFQWGG